MFANQSGLDMLETTLVALQDITLDKIFDESGRKALCSDFPKLMQQVVWFSHVASRCCWFKYVPNAWFIDCVYLYDQGFAYLPGGICASTMGRHVSYEQAVAWKVLEADETTVHCLAFSFINWSFVWLSFLPMAPSPHHWNRRNEGEVEDVCFDVAKVI